MFPISCDLLPTPFFFLMFFFFRTVQYLEAVASFYFHVEQNTHIQSNKYIFSFVFFFKIQASMNLVVGYLFKM